MYLDVKVVYIAIKIVTNGGKAVFHLSQLCQNAIGSYALMVTTKLASLFLYCFILVINIKKVIPLFDKVLPLVLYIYISIKLYHCLKLVTLF